MDAHVNTDPPPGKKSSSTSVSRTSNAWQSSDAATLERCVSFDHPTHGCVFKSLDQNIEFTVICDKEKHQMVTLQKLEKNVWHF